MFLVRRILWVRAARHSQLGLCESTIQKTAHFGAYNGQNPVAQYKQSCTLLSTPWQYIKRPLLQFSEGAYNTKPMSEPLRIMAEALYLPQWNRQKFMILFTLCDKICARISEVTRTGLFYEFILGNS